VTTPPTVPPSLERLAERLRHDLPGLEVGTVPSDYVAPGWRADALRLRLGHRLWLDVADDGGEWSTHGLYADRGGVTPVGERAREALAVAPDAEARVVSLAVVASVWRWVDSVGPGEADAPFVLSRSAAPPAIPTPAAFDGSAPALLARPPMPRRRRGLLVAGVVTATTLVLALVGTGVVAGVSTVTTAVTGSGWWQGPDGGDPDSGAPGASGDQGTGDDGSGDDGAEGGGGLDPDPGATSDTSTYDLVVGDCFSFAADSMSGGGLSGVDVRPCPDEHQAEIYLEDDLPGGAWPGQEEVGAEADDLCYGAFAGFVGIEWEDSVVEYSSLVPSESSWAEGDRAVSCYVFIGGVDQRGTLEGLGE